MRVGGKERGGEPLAGFRAEHGAERNGRAFDDELHLLPVQLRCIEAAPS